MRTNTADDELVELQLLYEIMYLTDVAFVLFRISCRRTR